MYIYESISGIVVVLNIDTHVKPHFVKLIQYWRGIFKLVSPATITNQFVILVN